MGVTSAPATEAIMGAVSRSGAGVGSAVNDATRLIGGTLGVAVIGSVCTSVYGSRLSATTPRGPARPGDGARAAYTAAGAILAAAFLPAQPKRAAEPAAPASPDPVIRRSANADFGLAASRRTPGAIILMVGLRHRFRSTGTPGTPGAVSPRRRGPARAGPRRW
jgi:hypothetical protein